MASGRESSSRRLPDAGWIEFMTGALRAARIAVQQTKDGLGERGPERPPSSVTPTYQSGSPTSTTTTRS